MLGSCCCAGVLNGGVCDDSTSSDDDSDDSDDFYTERVNAAETNKGNLGKTVYIIANCLTFYFICVFIYYVSAC